MLIVGDKTYTEGMPVKFWACNIGADYAQLLADVTGSPMTFTGSYVRYFSDARTPYVHQGLHRENGSRITGAVGPPGRFRTVYPASWDSP